MMRLSAAIRGDLKKIMKEEMTAAETAVTAGVREVTNGLKGDLRQQVLSAGLGQGVAKAWQTKFYPSGKSLNAAGYLYTKAPDIVYAFGYGAVIKSSKGFFLAIPTAAAPKRGMNGKRINPSNFPEASMGRLRFVYRPGKHSLLVVDDLRARTGKRGGFAQASESARRTGRSLTTVVMFILVPQVSLKKRLDLEGAVAKWEPTVPEKILSNWPEVKAE